MVHPIVQRAFDLSFDVLHVAFRPTLALVIVWLLCGQVRGHEIAARVHEAIGVVFVIYAAASAPLLGLYIGGLFIGCERSADDDADDET